MTAQFATPGPWEVKKDDDQFRIRQKGTVRRIAGGTVERPVGEGFNYKLDAQLAACAPELRDALTEAAETLRKYEILHWAKETPESDAKAKVNGDLAAKFEALIARANGESK